MKTVSVQTWCDYPGCALDAQEQGMMQGQEVGNMDFWVNAFGGRKTKPIKVVMCPEHRDQMKVLFTEMAKYDQRKGGETGDDNDGA